MATVTLKGNTLNTIGNLPQNQSKAENIELVKTDLSTLNLTDYLGKKVVLNIFPSVDTGVCAQSVRQFNKDLSSLENTVVICVSKDLPFAQNRFCAAEGLDNVIMASDFRTDFGKVYGVEMTDGPLKGLLARAVVVLNEEGTIVYTELVPEITTEPNYEAALTATK
ncbi:thiol peroxidase [Paenimyroides tangerinum]|uniref:Thiol peroxidase n=1 Tax=Paenimyroides tangerinum TaxID=2488728 RepID=A0A3P3W393_9FLAO|nr:thiol peroxidase [Paenimyroides tangerinum]RRJ88119.1 thiol peroxidase [Paenimyroides tangerinum]